MQLPRMKMQAGFFAAKRFDELAPEWDALYVRDPNAHIFLSSAFLKPIFERSSNMAILTCRSDNELVGALPVSIETIWDTGQNCYRTDFKMAGSKFWADYCGFLIHPDVQAKTLDTIAEFLKGQSWARLRLKNLRLDPALRETFFTHFPKSDFGRRDVKKTINSGQTNNLLSSVLSLPNTFDGYTDALSKNTRQKLRRFLRKLDAGAFSIRQGEKKDLAEFTRQWARQWEQKPRAEELANRYSDIVGTGLTTNILDMWVLEEVPDGSILGTICNYRDPVKKQISFFVSSRSLETNVPVGMMLHGYAIRKAIDEGYLKYDFLRGDETYKADLGAKLEVLYYPVLRRRSHMPSQDLLSPLSLRPLVSSIEALADAGDYDRIKAAARQISSIIG